MANARQYLDRVGLDLHPPAASVALLTPPKLVVDGGDIDGQTGGNAFDNGDEGLAVRFACCCELKEHKMDFTAKSQRRRSENQRITG